MKGAILFRASVIETLSVAAANASFGAEAEPAVGFSAGDDPAAGVLSVEAFSKASRIAFFSAASHRLARRAESAALTMASAKAFSRM